MEITKVASLTLKTIYPINEIDNGLEPFLEVDATYDDENEVIKEKDEKVVVHAV